MGADSPQARAGLTSAAVPHRPSQMPLVGYDVVVDRTCVVVRRRHHVHRCSSHVEPHPARADTPRRRCHDERAVVAAALVCQHTASSALNWELAIKPGRRVDQFRAKSVTVGARMFVQPGTRSVLVQINGHATIASSLPTMATVKAGGLAGPISSNSRPLELRLSSKYSLSIDAARRKQSRSHRLQLALIS